MLTDAQIDRYSRQIILPEVGARGQERLLSASIALVDEEDDAALLLLYLAAAGVGQLKVWSAKPFLSWESLINDARGLNADCDIEIAALDVDQLSARDTDVVLLAESAPGLGPSINAVCLRQDMPLIWSRTHGGRGYLAVLDPAAGAGCYDCAAAALPGVSAATASSGDSCARALLTTIQATEAIKTVVGMPPALAGMILCIDPFGGRVTTLPMGTGCRTCGARSPS